MKQDQTPVMDSMEAKKKRREMLLDDGSIPQVDVNWLFTGNAKAQGLSRGGRVPSPENLLVEPQGQREVRQERRNSEACRVSINEQNDTALRRTQSLSTDSKGHTSEGSRKRGFLTRMFGRRKDRQMRSSPPMRAERRSDLGAVTQGSNPVSFDETGLMRMQTEPTKGRQEERLREFLQYYRKVGFETFQRQLAERTRPASAGRPVDHFASSLGKTTQPKSNDGLEHFAVDRLGRRIPPHPDAHKFPSILKPARRSAYSDTTIPRAKAENAATNKFEALLRKVASYSADESPGYSTRLDIDRSTNGVCKAGNNGLVKHSNQYHDIPGLEGQKPLKRVSFARNTYFNSPPQQICSRNPRKGEVEVKPDGSVVIHKLTPSERRNLIQNSTGGLVVGGSGQLKLINPFLTTNESEYDHKKVQEKYGTSARPPSPPPPPASKLHDGSAALGSCPSSDSTLSMGSSGSDRSESLLPPPAPIIPNDTLYTRCCYLREILPIPAMLKQLKPGSSDPIPLLQLRNPKPSMIEILSLGDFLSVAPVLCFSMDGVSLSVHMLHIILSSLRCMGRLEKLSMRNTPLDEEGWKTLVYFISSSKSLRGVDLTMVPGLPLNVQKPSKSSDQCSIQRMKCDLTCRSDQNWNLFTAAVAINGNLEELIISGAKMSLGQFKILLDLGCHSVERLGLAYNDLSDRHCEALASWLLECKVAGLDLGFNSLSGKMRPFAEALMRKSEIGNNLITCISLNSTDLTIAPHATVETSDVVALLSALGYCENLKFLDLSNNPDMFIYGMKSLTDILPVLVNFGRLQLDYNNLSSTNIITLAEVLPMCNTLGYLSLVGSKLDTSSGAALALALKKSDTLFTIDADFSEMPDAIKHDVSIYSLKNLENVLELSKAGHGMERSASLQQELAVLLAGKTRDKEDYDNLVENFAKRICDIRKRLKTVTEDLFKLRVRGELSTEGKETLIRFCFLDSSFEKALSLLAQRDQRQTVILKQFLDDSEEENHRDTAKPSDGDLLKNVESEAESCIRHVPSINSISSTSFRESGHAALLPFHQPPIEKPDPADDAIELRCTSHSASSHADEQTREEGEMLRKTRGIMKGLEQSAKDRGARLCTETLKQIVEGYDCESIKKFLLGRDVNDIIAILDELQTSGVGIDDIFKKGRFNSDQSAHTKFVRTKRPAAPCSIDEPQPGATPELDDENTYSALIDRAYDNVLDDLERTRSNHEKE
ncbi:AaceriACR059Wp [[Ashbya] aceris (nom. inval.)]|nr:AaceriACR059Wp [[Ashbya] aceris (nom. inval.)]